MAINQSIMVFHHVFQVHTDHYQFEVPLRTGGTSFEDGSMSKKLGKPEIFTDIRSIIVF